MRRWIALATLSIMTLSSSGLFADCTHNTRSSNNFLIPIGRFIVAPESGNDLFAFSFLGEAGTRNYRFGGAASSWTTERSRLKISGEYLTQKLGWAYTSGKVRRWNQQGAVSLDWQYLLDDCSIFQALDVTGYYGYVSGKTPNEVYCGTVAIPGGNGADQYSVRHIAGSNSAGGALTSVMLLSEGSRLDVSLNYDYVHYRRNFYSNKKVAGFGGSFVWTNRILPCCMDFSLEAQFRRPFNYFGARLTLPRQNFKNVDVTLFGGVTRGKDRLPNSTAVGIELAYNFGCKDTHAECCPPLWDACNLQNWTRAAPILPEVMAIAEEIYFLDPIPPAG